MERILNFMQTRKNVWVYAVIASLILSFIHWCYQQPINPDAIIYLKTAKAYLQSGFSGAMSHYLWPLYPILIAYVSQLTHLSMLNSAYLLNALLLAILAFAFVRLIKALGGNAACQWLAILVLLAFPRLNHVSFMIVRGFGYYAFALLSVLFLLHHLRTGKFYSALLWSFSLIIATLFRIEGAFILALAWLCVIAQTQWSWKRRILSALELNCLSILIVVALGIWLLTTGHLSVEHIGRGKTIIHDFTHGSAMLSLYANYYIDLLKQHVLNPISAVNAKVILFSGVLGIFIVTMFTNLNPLYCILSYHGYTRSQLDLDKSAKLVLISYVVINLFLLFAFILQNLFVTGRYLMLLNLILMLSIPFSLKKIWQMWKHRKPKLTPIHLVAPAVSIVMFIFLLGTFLNVGPNKHYMVQAGHWIKQQHIKPKQFYSNALPIYFYAGVSQPKNRIEYSRNNLSMIKDLQTMDLSHYHYLAIVVYKKYLQNMHQTLKTLPVDVSKRYVNNRGDTIFILKVNNYKNKKDG